MTWNCNWLWGSSSEDLSSVEYPLPLLPGSFIPGVKVPVRVLSMGQIDLFHNYSYSIGQCAKKNPKKNLNNYIKNVNMNEQWMQFSNL